MGGMERTLALETTKKVGEKVILFGWVNSRRDHGKVVFIDLRDRSGLVQVVIRAFDRELHGEDVVRVEGKVAYRKKGNENPDLPTGSVEIVAEEIEVLAKSETPPFDVHSQGLDIEEALRLKYRYLDLRRPRLQRNLRVRSDYVQAAREYLFDQSFVEIETPLLTKSTPEGSRDFIVPSRIYPGKFYALPQAPQQYKQLLMTAGFERYFQVARALRDEDTRADRGFEHTQIDIEMSFVSPEDVMKTVEGMTLYALDKIGAKVAKKPFPVFTYKEVMKRFGSERFDLRSEKEKKDGVLSFAWVVEFPFFEKNKEGSWTFTHNPFSAPTDKAHEKLLLEKKRIGEIIASQYDLVCNGLEVAGGGIRSNKPEVLKSVFEVLGYEEEEIEEKFGHMVEAFRFGTPPHGGCAQGFERLLMAYLGEDYLREVQAFPMTGSGRTAVMDAPSEVSEKQLRELGIEVRKKRKKK